MYLDHFRLQRHPFVSVPDTTLFYEGGHRGALLHALMEAILDGEALLKVVGAPGSGKTLFCRMLGRRLPDEVTLVYLVNPSLTPNDLIWAVASELCILSSDDDTPTPGRAELLHLIQTHLLQQHAEGRRVVVLVEEAQAISPETLEELRLLSNLETERQPLLQLVLFGRPALERLLATPALRPLEDRIVSSFVLDPLDLSGGASGDVRLPGRQRHSGLDHPGHLGHCVT